MLIEEPRDTNTKRASVVQDPTPSCCCTQTGHLRHENSETGTTQRAGALPLPPLDSRVHGDLQTRHMAPHSGLV
jgi:hypothetical protein